MKKNFPNGGIASPIFDKNGNFQNNGDGFLSKEAIERITRQIAVMQAYVQGAKDQQKIDKELTEEAEKLNKEIEEA